MKYNKILKSLTYGLIVTMGVGTMASCTDGFEEANRQGNRASADELGRDNYSTGSSFKCRITLFLNRKMLIK